MNEARSARDRLDRALSIIGRTRRFVAPALVVLVLGGMASLGVASIRKHVFRSETLILYREGIRSDIVGGEEGSDRARKLGMRLKEMVLSRTRLEQIIKEAKLYQPLIEERGMIDAVDEMRKHIAFRVQDGDIFGLSFEGEDPARVQQITVKLADALIDENSRNASEAAGQTKDFLDREKLRTEVELKQKETALAQFLAKHPEFAREASAGTGQQAGTAIRAATAKAAATPVKGDPALASLEREAGRLQERLGMPNRRPVVKREEPQIDPAIEAARQDAEKDVTQAQAELTDKQTKFTEEHPDVRAAKARLRLAQDKLKRATDAYNNASANVAKQKDATGNDDEGYIDRGALENQLKRINDEIAVYKRRRANATNESPTLVASSVVALETEWTRLNREVADARERFQSLQEKEFKASMVESAAATGNTAQMVVIDPAFLPTHAANSGRKVVAAAGVAVSFVLALALAFLLALLDDRLYDRVDVERLGVLPLLGVVPRAGKKVKRG